MNWELVPNWYFLAVYWALFAGLLLLFSWGVFYWRRSPGWGRAAIAANFLGSLLFVAYRLQLRYQMHRGFWGPSSLLFAIILTYWALSCIAMICLIRRGAIGRPPDNVIPRRREDDWG